MLRTHGAGKGPGGCGGWGLGSRARRPPDVSPTPALRGQGTSPGSPAGFLGGVGGANTLLFSPVPPRGPLPPASPDLPGLLPMPPGPTWPGGGLWGWVPAWELSRLPVLSGEVHSSLALPGGSLPAASPDLAGLRGADPVWPPLLLPPHSHHVLLVHMGVPRVSLGIRVLHQRPAGTLVVGRC